MRYISTRGEAPTLGFSDTLLTGLARDGGLYLPESWPQFSKLEIAAFAGKSYADIAFSVLTPFVEGDIKPAAFRAMIDAAYGTFRHEAVCPLVQTGPNEFIVELFHGPTLAFKDVAMQLLARLMDHVLTERDQYATIVGATSGDTGGAAIDAFAGRARTDMFILFPHGRVSPVQQRQMTTSTASNVHALAIEGNFDDCQDMVKAMFNDHEYRDRMQLSGVNSINWARIMAQVVYYFTTAVSLGAPHRTISFSVPTGNFGDIFAGYVAKQMGLPIERLVIATNDNDILARTLETGRYEMQSVIQTTSPSMDIGISSNFERLLFEAHGRDAGAVRTMMASLKQSGGFSIGDKALAHIKGVFLAGRSDMAATASMVARLLSDNGYLADPHTAIGVKVAREQKVSTAPMVVLSTAHPAKFPDAVKAASGVEPTLPHFLSNLMSRQEKFTVLPSSLELVQGHIEDNARVAN